MTTYEALWMAVCSAPDDDTPRLVMADWLDEHGQGERAFYIRHQISQFTNSAAYWDDDQMRRSINIIQGVPDGERYARRILWGPWRILPSGAGRWTFSRGFVNSINTTAADWLKYADLLYWHPKQKVKCDQWCCHLKEPQSNCVVCKCSGVMDRPFPTDPLPHPITEVRLTTPITDVGGGTGWGNCLVANSPANTTTAAGTTMVLAFTSDRFPGITFYLPE